MNRIVFLCLCYSYHLVQFAQNPATAPLPDKFKDLPEVLSVNHFPSPVYASEDADRSDFQYFWKHNTAVMATGSDVEVLECGAYIFYNDQWNLRVSHDGQTFADLFNCPQGILKKGEPYTFPNNWRTDNRLFGGWAMWYVIGTDGDGRRVFGVGKLETVGELLKP